MIQVSQIVDGKTLRTSKEVNQPSRDETQEGVVVPHKLATARKTDGGRACHFIGMEKLIFHVTQEEKTSVQVRRIIANLHRQRLQQRRRL